MQDVREALMAGRASDGKAVRRPLSPHLQVYRPQISSTLSILHRITGVGLGVGTLLLVWWLVALAGGAAAFAGVQWFVSSWVGLILLFGWTVALLFHFCNGIRHLAWDMGYGFEKQAYHASGWTVVAVSVVASLVIWAVGLAVW
ncbi:MAG TPA: succinate dehydrogenase, cytochrome b556 subunit [Acetobacteraceae bacterium]|nr:succinate dehydrogenase, cytochrome b556 subunit [Acetobacteraceae bacterium]